MHIITSFLHGTDTMPNWMILLYGGMMWACGFCTGRYPKN